MTITSTETRHDRVVVAHEAGYKRPSLISIIAGVFVAYGAFAVIVAIVAGVLDAANVEDVRYYDWETVGNAGAIAAGVSLFIAYLFGGYVAGRMARRAGLVQGLGVFVLGIVVAGVIGASINAATDTGAVVDDLRRIGVPTSWDEWSSVGTLAGILSLGAMFLGSLFGGVLGDRWHSKLTRRAVDPDYGPDHVVVDQDDRDLDGVDLRERTVVRGTADTEVVNRVDKVPSNRA